MRFQLQLHVPCCIPLLTKFGTSVVKLQPDEDSQEDMRQIHGHGAGVKVAVLHGNCCQIADKRKQSPRMLQPLHAMALFPSRTLLGMFLDYLKRRGRRLGML